MSIGSIRSGALLAAMIALACAHGQATEGAKDADAKDAEKKEGPAASGEPSLEDQFKRELSTPLPKRAFTTPAGVKGEVEASAAPEAVEDGETEKLTVPLGTRQTMACSLYKNRIDPGGTLQSVVAAVGKQFQVVGFRLLDAGEAGGSAIVFAELIYTADMPQGRVVGQLKLSVYAHKAHSMVCEHDEPGYTQTFARIVRGLAASLHSGREDPRASARYREIQIIKLGPLTVGVAEKSVWGTEGGGQIKIIVSSQIIPRSRTEFVALDSVSQEESDPAGKLISYQAVSVSNGEVISQIKLTAQRGGKTFAYEGSKGGKRLKGTFTTKAGLATDSWLERQYDAKHNYGPEGEVRHEIYSVEADPTAPQQMVARKDPSSLRRLKVRFAGLTMTGELDEHGQYSTSELTIGPATLVSRRVWETGTP